MEKGAFKVLILFVSEVLLIVLFVMSIIMLIPPLSYYYDKWSEYWMNKGSQDDMEIMFQAKIMPDRSIKYGHWEPTGCANNIPRNCVFIEDK